MPSSDLLNKYGKWFLGHTKKVNKNSGNKFDLLVPGDDLYRLDHQIVLSHATSHLWRFRPSALVIETDRKENLGIFHVMLGVSNAIALKDVGELNCYVRIMGAKSGCLISPKGVSNEVRLVQAEASIRDRLFRARDDAGIFLIEWDSSTNSVIPNSVIPIETEL